MFLPVLFIFFTFFTNGSSGTIVSNEYQTYKSATEKCEKITIEMCSDIPYNMTIYPNLLKHTNQEEAEAEIKQYEMLVKVKCSEDFKFFLCTLFTPVCTIMERPLPPCRTLCMSAKHGCEDLLRKFGYEWPQIFKCDTFPDNNNLCVGENRTSTAPLNNSKEIAPKLRPTLKPELECPHTMKILSKSSYSLTVANSTIEQCSLPCQGNGFVPTFFPIQIRNYLRLWTGAWAVACCVCTLFTILTFLIDLHRFEFPERAILYLALCHLFVSIVYMVGLGAEDSLSCSAVSATKSALVTQGVDNFACTAMSVTHYYFTTAGYIWWVILCFAWVFVTTLKWGEGPVGHVFSSYFHIFAWGLPCLMTITILVTNNIDGDVFTGVCSVGNLKPSVLFNFVVLPQLFFVVGGFVLFVIGFISILRIRSYIRGQPSNLMSKFDASVEAASEKIRNLMLRILCFALLYAIPAGIGAFCTLLQTQYMEHWLTGWYSTRCLHAQRGTFGFTQPRELCPLSTENLGALSPEPVIFFIKYLTHFTAGIACAVWTVNGKTFNSYGNFYARIFHGGRSRVPTRVH